MAKNKHIGSSLDSFLEEQGILTEVRTQAIKEVIACKLAVAMKERKLSKSRLAELMHASRAQVDRVLDPASHTVTLETLQRAALVIGRKVQIELV